MIEIAPELLATVLDQLRSDFPRTPESERSQLLARLSERYPQHQRPIQDEYARLSRWSLVSTDPKESSERSRLSAGKRYRHELVLEDGPIRSIRCRDVLLERDVLLKIAAHPDDNASLLREAAHYASLSHPVIPPVHDMGLDSGDRFFYLTNLPPTASWDTKLGSTLESSRESLILFHRACLAVGYGHAVGSSHGRITTESIRVGSHNVLAVIDWGFDSPSDDARDVGDLGLLLERWIRTTGATLRSRVDESRGALRASLEELVRRATQADVTQRPTCTEFAAIVLESIEGDRARRRRRDAAARALLHARRSEQARGSCARRVLELRRLVDEQRPPGWVPVAEKRQHWSWEEELVRVERAEREHGDEALLALLAAHRNDPVATEVAARLEAVLWRRLSRAERRGDEGRARFYGRQLIELNAGNVARIRGAGRLEFSLTPAADSIWVRLLVQRSRRWIGGEWQRWSESQRLPKGRYEVRLDRRGYRSVHAPVTVDRDEVVRCCWEFRTEEEIGSDFVQIPVGTFPMGGDARAADALPASDVHVSEFFVGRFPITWGEYAEFLRDLGQDGAKSLREHQPRCTWRGETIEEGERMPVLNDDDERRPVCGLSLASAHAYARWRSERDGRAYGLPTEAEWEKAARGVDGRPYPWGPLFDEAFCGAGSPSRLTVDPIGAHPVDRSPYGVMDLAGGVMEWCDDWFSDEHAVVRGGHWRGTPTLARCASRNSAPPSCKSPLIGLRLVHRPRGGRRS